MQVVGNRIRELREEKNLSMLQLAEKIGVSNAAICKWENQIAEPKASYIYNLANFFNVSTDYLLGRTDDFGSVIASPTAPALTKREETLLRYFRSLSSELQEAAIETTRVLAGVPADGLQKKA